MPRALRLLPVGLLTLGIAIHGWGIVVHDLDSQRGTAFAMFASVDIGATRKVIATTTDPNGTVVVEMPERLMARSRELADSPRPELARELATLVGRETLIDDVVVRVYGLSAHGHTITRTLLVSSDPNLDGAR